MTILSKPVLGDQQDAIGLPQPADARYLTVMLVAVLTLAVGGLLESTTLQVLSGVLAAVSLVGPARQHLGRDIDSRDSRG